MAEAGTLDLWLVRHGSSAPNVERRYPAAQEDAPLSARGTAQMQALASLLPRGEAQVSPARRARESAALAGFSSAREAPALREAHFGVMSGCTWAELESDFGEAPRRWIDALSRPDSDEGPPGGESGRAFHARLQGWLGELPERGVVLAFTHAGPIRAVVRLTLQLGALEVWPGHALVLRKAGGEWWLVGLNWPPAQDLNGG